MNEVKLSGILGDVTEKTSAAGNFLTARLRFNKSDEVLLLAAGEKAQALGLPAPAAILTEPRRWNANSLANWVAKYRSKLNGEWKPKSADLRLEA